MASRVLTSYYCCDDCKEIVYKLPTKQSKTLNMKYMECPKCNKNSSIRLKLLTSLAI